MRTLYVNIFLVLSFLYLTNLASVAEENFNIKNDLNIYYSNLEQAGQIFENNIQNKKNFKYKDIADSVADIKNLLSNANNIIHKYPKVNFSEMRMYSDFVKINACIDELKNYSGHKKKISYQKLKCSKSFPDIKNKYNNFNNTTEDENPRPHGPIGRDEPIFSPNLSN